jgi:hypothetical protein
MNEKLQIVGTDTFLMNEKLQIVGNDTFYDTFYV